MALSKMLLPVAGEPRDADMLAYACGLVDQGVHELLVAHVVEGRGMEAPVILAAVERARGRLWDMVQPHLGSGMSVEVRVTTGSIHPEILALAHQVNVDVILCGTEGKSFVDYLFSGSISEDLALTGDQRTMTVRYDLIESEEQANRMGRDFAKRLVVPVDFSSSSLRAVLSAFNRPPEALGTLHIVHVLADAESRADAEAHMRGMTAIAEEHGADYVAAIIEGPPQEAVLGYLSEVGATGCITGRRGRSQLGRGFLGSVSMRLLQDAPCPVVIQP